VGIETKPLNPFGASPKPQSVTRILIFVLTAALSPGLIALAYIQVRHFGATRSRETPWTAGTEGGWEQVIPTVWGDLLIGGLILLGAVFSVMLAVRSGRLILSDMSLIRESIVSWNKSGAQPAQPHIPRISELRETAALVYDAVQQRARMEEALHQSERRWQELAEGLPHLVWTCVPEGACDFLSKQWVAHTGSGEDEHLGYGWLENLHPEDRPVIMERWRNAVEEGTLFDAEFRIRRHDGVYRWFKSRAVPVHDESGEVYKWYGANSDIHNLRELQAALSETSERLRRALENIPDGVIIYDPELHVQYVNDSMTKIAGRSASEMLGRREEELWPPEVYSAYHPVLIEARETRSDRSVEVDVQVDGRRIYAFVRFVPLLDDEGALKEIMGFVHDLTKWKLTDLELQRKQVALEISRRLTAEKEAMLHEEKVRALTAELIVAEDEERRRIAVEIHDRIGQNLAISKIKLGMALKAATPGDLTNLLSVTRELIGQTIEDTRSLSFELSPPALRETDLHQALEELVEYFQSIHKTDVDFSWSGSMVDLERNQIIVLYMAVRELLLNVVKHARASKASLAVLVFGSQLQIQVEDNGTSLLDNAAFQENVKTKGFGLTMMDQRLQSISGTFSLDSSQGRGTRAVITVPLHAKHKEGVQTS